MLEQFAYTQHRACFLAQFQFYPRHCAGREHRSHAPCHGSESVGSGHDPSRIHRLCKGEFRQGQFCVARHGQVHTLVWRRLLFGFAPSTDTALRLVAEKLGGALVKAAIVENVMGAAGNIAADRVAKASPDGHTIGVLTAGNIVVNAKLYKNLPYDPLCSVC